MTNNDLKEKIIEATQANHMWINKKDSELCQLSIEHWERMIDKLKWVMESNLTEKLDKYIFASYLTIFAIEIENILGESWGRFNCSFCLVYWRKTKCGKCPLYKIEENCKAKKSAYQKTIKTNNVNEFIEAAEKYMIPILKRAKQKCVEEEE